MLESLFNKVAGLKFTIFTGKHLFWGLSLIKLQAFRPTTLLKNDSNTCFPLNMAGLLRTPI